MVPIPPRPAAALILPLLGGLLAAGCGERPPAGPRAEPAGAPAAAAIPKPDPPMDLELLFVPDPDPVKPARLTVAVTPRTDLPEIRVSIQLPEGAEAVEGKAAWRGTIARGRREARDMVVRLPAGRPHVLRASAVADLGGGARAVQTAELVVGGPAGPKPAPLGEPKTNSRGEAILEMKAK
jgi:hypothetical protein